MPAGRPRKIFTPADPGYRADRHAESGDAVPATGTPMPTRKLDAHGLCLWGAVVPGLIAAKIVGEADSQYLTDMCFWYSVHERAMKLVDEALEGGKIPTAVTAAAIAWDKFDKIASRFGLTPSDRAKLRVQPAATGGVEARKR